MSDTALSVNNLGKQFRIGSGLEYGTLRDSLVGLATLPFRWMRRRPAPAAPIGGASTPRPPRHHVWALKDVSFDVNPGEAVGIVGRNGAGKSTLLKILSRITEPTLGTAEITGRVGSLLEVGTGFHQELTGRENIYMNGALLGMRRAEIERKFDQIVAFSEVEDFLDTPVKRYSTGMYMRLAFAVAAHLEPEILVVDEVLAVGDAAFQKKCLGKMGEVAKEGRTVLFVSHNMAAVQSLCQKAVLLQNGRLVRQGSAKEVVQTFLESVMTSDAVSLDQRTDRGGDGSARAVAIRVENADQGTNAAGVDNSTDLIRTSSRLKITLRYKSERPMLHPAFMISIHDLNNSGIYLFDSDAVNGLPETLAAEGEVTCYTDPINLTAGRCYLNVMLKKGAGLADYVQYAAFFDVEADDLFGTGKLPPRDWVTCVLRHRWSAG